MYSGVLCVVELFALFGVILGLLGSLAKHPSFHGGKQNETLRQPNLNLMIDRANSLPFSKGFLLSTK